MNARAAIVAGLGGIVCVAASGCASGGQSSASTSSVQATPAQQPAQQPVKPIDQVRSDIVLVQQRVTAALRSAEARAADLPAQLTAADSAITGLRDTVAQLDRRADEYLAMWSGQATVVVTDAGIYKSPNEQPARGKAKYEQMLTALRSARDQVNPALTGLRQLAERPAMADASAVLDRAREQGTSGVAQLDVALKRLDELNEIIRPGSGGR